MKVGTTRGQRSLAIAAIAAAIFALWLAVASAKGGPSPVKTVIISGPGAAAVEVAIDLPENYDHMAELYPASARAAELTATLRYEIVIRHDWGNGVAADYAGSYDGGSLFFFPEPLRANGNVMERGGWYEANPLFAEQVVAALPPGPPAAGTGMAREARGQHSWLPALILAAAATAGAAFAVGGIARARRR
jgi:hypothetical protein